MERLRIATWNIHKGVSGLVPLRRLEIHNLAQAVEGLDADVVCLQEVSKFHHLQAKRFANWPAEPQADVLAPEGYHAAYATNAVRSHSEHGNALLARWPIEGQTQHDLSAHRFEQRGLLHVRLKVHAQNLHVIVVHLALTPKARYVQIERIAAYVASEVPEGAPLVLAGDFNDWGERLHEPLRRVGLRTFEAMRLPTFPSRLPMLHLDRIYVRGLVPASALVPRGKVWARMSDHLPLVGEFDWERAS